MMVDPREVPAYDPAEAAHYLHLPSTTVRNWAHGNDHFRCVVSLPSRNATLLSFMNLVEIHVLSAIRRHHKIPMQKVRRAIAYLQRHSDHVHPLAMHEFETDGVDLFIQELDKTVNVVREGQVAMRNVIEAHLRRIEWDREGMPAVLYPFVSPDISIARKPVMFDPRIEFGRLVLVNTGIPTVEIAQRYKAGESIDGLADDYGRKRLEIEDAIRCELRLAAAA
ncbi:MAG: DUF433 domain-containing protein [Firmicutes bacterium]|nr:DUF433 domain-containing protein [Bacillota bacterium]